MKDKIRRIIGFILIIIGLSIIISIVYKKIETSKKQKELQNVLEELITGEGTVSDMTEEERLKFKDGYTPIALIEIPSIKLYQGIIEGISDDVLLYYLGHFEGTAMPGEKGNFGVAGHRVSNYSDALVNLYKAEIGGDIIVKANNKEYTYKITESFIVEPNRVDVLENTEEATITLVTCTVGAEERLIVKGKLVDTKELTKEGNNE